MNEQQTVVRIAAVGDIHTRKSSQGAMQPMFREMTERADVALLCGDLTDYGAPEEAEILAHDISSALRIPAIAVLGNHDFESGHQDEVARILAQAGVTMLDGDAHEFRGIGFAGVKGFIGGFGRRQLRSWGEQSLQDLVHETLEEALKLEAALARLRTPQKIAVLHYAPIQATVEGEPPEIIPFCGSSRLEEPIDRYRVTAVFHGHSHHGSPEGRTHGNAPVYNVAMPLLKRLHPDRPPFRVIEVPVGEAVRAQRLESRR
jgi:Icc-related predicted phosphoesterase